MTIDIRRWVVSAVEKKPQQLFQKWWGSGEWLTAIAQRHATTSGFGVGGSDDYRLVKMKKLCNIIAIGRTIIASLGVKL